ncbi:MAG TPA: metallophosphoesterase [Candidatus Kapabacteria bacterium]|nr:metallophosphoesterase [Candidatus Kapabacteria bacterium]
MMRSEPIRVVQITDTHLLADAAGRVGGVDSFAALERLLPLVRGDGWTPDAIVATGDISDDGTPASYRRFRDLMVPLGIPVYCIPGNHDDMDTMQDHLPGGPIQLRRSLDTGAWLLLFLDSHVPGKAYGSVARDDLDALGALLRDLPQRHVLLCMHHTPLPICAMPDCRLENAEQLMNLLAQHSCARAVIAGHVHCAADERHAGVDMLVTPSTCVQVEHPAGPDLLPQRPFLEVHRLDASRGGLRRLELHPDGRVVTEVIWG